MPDELLDAKGAPRRQLHLRPAAIEHLLAIDRLWPGMDPADQQALSSCYTPRFSTHAARLTTLYVPLSDGTSPSAHDSLDVSEGLGVTRRLRPLRLEELTELLRVYVVREPQPTAAILALPAHTTPPAEAISHPAPTQAANARAAERDRRHANHASAHAASAQGRGPMLTPNAEEETLHHLYCVLSSPPGSHGNQCYLLQLQPASEVGGRDAAGAVDEALASPPLVELCQAGALHTAFSSSSTKLRRASMTPPTIALKALESAVGAATKVHATTAELTARVQVEASPAPPMPERATSPGRHRGGSSPGRSSHH